MKIRINGNSLRVRLSRSEVERFGTNGIIEEKTEIGNNVLVYALEKSDTRSLAATFHNGRITMLVPGDMAHDWVTSDTVGYNNNMDLGNGKSLFLLLEKDFKCIDNAMEDQSDNYENPSKTC
jgi:hypothetical protein